MDHHGDNFYRNLMTSPNSPDYRHSDDPQPNPQAIDLGLTYDDSTCLTPNYGFNQMYPGFSTQCAIGGEASASAKPKKKPSKSKQAMATVKEASATLTSRAARQQWTNEEDKVLVSAYLNTSLDEVKGTDRSGTTFWDIIGAYYNKHRTSGGGRDGKSCKNRWHVINSQVGKFIGCYQQATNRKKSGEAESDVIMAAHTLYESDMGKAFKMVHAWLLLRDEPKWRIQGEDGSNKRTRINVEGNYSTSSSVGTSSQPTTPGTPCTPSSGPTDPIEEGFPIPEPVRLRPMGVKAAKRKAKENAMPSVAECPQSAEGVAAMDKMAEALQMSAKTKQLQLYQKLASKDVLTPREEKLVQFLEATLFP